MDTPLTTTVAAPAAPVAAPTPAPVAPVTPAAPVTPVSNNGGGNSVSAIFKSLNWLEIGFGILGSAALYYTIYYYKYSNSIQKGLFNEIQNKVDDLQIKVSDISSSLEKKAQTAENLW